MSQVVVFSVGGLLFIATAWATFAFLLARVVRIEGDSTPGDRREVDSLPPPSQT